MASAYSAAWPAVMRNATGKPALSASRWIFSAQSTPGTPQSLVAEAPFTARGRLLVRSDDGPVKHEIQVLLILDQVVEEALPDARLRPSHEPFVHTFVLAIALRQIVPANSGPKNPQHPVDEQSIVAAVRPTCSKPPGSVPLIRSLCASLNSYRLGISPLKQNQAETKIYRSILPSALNHSEEPISRSFSSRSDTRRWISSRIARTSSRSWPFGSGRGQSSRRKPGM